MCVTTKQQGLARRNCRQGEKIPKSLGILCYNVHPQMWHIGDIMPPDPSKVLMYKCVLSIGRLDHGTCRVVLYDVCTNLVRLLLRWLWAVIKAIIRRVTVFAHFCSTLHNATRSTYHLTTASPKTKIWTQQLVDTGVSLHNISGSSSDLSLLILSQRGNNSLSLGWPWWTWAWWPSCDGIYIVYTGHASGPNGWHAGISCLFSNWLPLCKVYAVVWCVPHALHFVAWLWVLEAHVAKPWDVFELSELHFLGNFCFGGGTHANSAGTVTLAIKRPDGTTLHLQNALYTQELVVMVISASQLTKSKSTVFFYGNDAHVYQGD